MATVDVTSSPPPASSAAGGDPGLRTKATSPQATIPAMARRPTRSGRLGVDKQGEYTYKNTPSSTLMASLQLGLQVSIGSREPKPRRDILMTDFEVVDTVEFPADGSTITPAHKYRDFTFKTYSPEAFRFFREAFGILAQDYLLAMCAHPMREISNPGASGSLFYLSADDAFIIKTVQKKEAHFLQKLLPGYYLNLTQNKKTLLPKFFGLYRYKCGTVNIRIVVMNNLLPSTLKYHEKYDLKGSKYKRKANDSELRKTSPTFKDLDFEEKHTEGGGVHLQQEKYEILIRTLERDCKVLESFGIMDYSLLLGVHNIDQAKKDGETSSSRTNSPGGDVKGDDGHFLIPSRIELSKNFSIISVENIPLAIEGEEEATSPPRYPEGCIQGKLKGDRVLVYLGIIDILQSYRLKKKVEHTFKSMITDGNTVSVHNPSYYARRFHDFLEKTVFQKEKGKSKGKKASRLPGGARRAMTTGGVVRTQSMPHGRERNFSHQPQRPRDPGQLPTDTVVFSPLSTTSGDTTATTVTPIKSSLKPLAHKTVSTDSALPEIPMIEVILANSEDERGEAPLSKVKKLPGKGVRFADEIPAGKEEKRQTATELEESHGDKLTDDDEEKAEVSVDFDKVTGTSTPLSDESPSLVKRDLQSSSYTTPDISVRSTDASSSVVGGGDREGVMIGGSEGVGNGPETTKSELAAASPEARTTSESSNMSKNDGLSDVI